MKIQCSVCEAAEATVLCCADEAGLCWGCDQKVHDANMLASKHQRVPLISSSTSQIPKCDICQESVGYFFCLVDRALLCRKCDVSIHTANPLVLLHQRFLLTGVKVGLEITEAHTSPPSVNTHNAKKISEPEPHSLGKKTTPLSSTTRYGNSIPVQSSGCGDFPLSNPPFAGSTSEWQFDELVGYGDFTRKYSFIDNGSSKGDDGMLGDSNNPTILRAGEGVLDVDDCLGLGPETYLAVPQISSPATAFELCWPKNLQNPAELASFVPDVSSLPSPSENRDEATSSKRRRRL